ncbi:unnamed protein product [Heligmosomoides polygyrus]|uniref:Uncharacterized protein n=1 Tax=Heligmosomoides polygyrus TaxID=6339 RepID=A0A183FV68_HELPZ|nr:unnamed protein product [Heligmosomoides polygyrus]
MSEDFLKMDNRGFFSDFFVIESGSKRIQGLPLDKNYGRSKNTTLNTKPSEFAKQDYQPNEELVKRITTALEQVASISDKYKAVVDRLTDEKVLSTREQINIEKNIVEKKVTFITVEHFLIRGPPSEEAPCRANVDYCAFNADARCDYLDVCGLLKHPSKF